jgi:hypothetical protein
MTALGWTAERWSARCRTPPRERERVCVCVCVCVCACAHARVYMPSLCVHSALVAQRGMVRRQWRRWRGYSRAETRSPSCAHVAQVEAVYWGAFYEQRLQEGAKAIFHLEAFVAKFMSMYKQWAVSIAG